MREAAALCCAGRRAEERAGPQRVRGGGVRVAQPRVDEEVAVRRAAQVHLHTTRTPCAHHAHTMCTPRAHHAHTMRTPCAHHAHTTRTTCTGRASYATVGRSIMAAAGTAEACAAASARRLAMAVRGKRSSHRRAGGPGEAAARLRALSHVAKRAGSSLGSWLSEQSSGVERGSASAEGAAGSRSALWLAA